jgi:hypothetical protein
MRLLLLSAAVVAAVAGADTPTPSPRPSPSPSKAATRPRSVDTAKPFAKAGSPTPAQAGTDANKAPKPGATKDPGHVFTNADLPEQPVAVPSPSPAPGGAGRGSVNVLGSAAAPQTAPSPSGPVSPEMTEAYWRERAMERRREVGRAEQRVPPIEQRIADLRNDRNPTNLMDPNREQNRQAQLAQALADLERAKADVERAKQALTDLEEDARRKSIPPGWLRER